jgi:5-formyltetrahydrofolate cyclo-ligase
MGQRDRNSINPQRKDMKEKSAKDCCKLQKAELRNKFLKLRNAFDKKSALEAGRKIFEKVQNLKAYQDAETVMFYMSIGSEVETQDLIKSAIKTGKRIFIPAVTDIKSAKMEAFEISKIEDASQVVLGIKQPDLSLAQTVRKDEIDLIFVPAVVFDVNGFRIGYGKGFFDIWLKDIDECKTIGIAYDFQIIDDIPKDEYDIPVGSVITERNAYGLNN